MGVMALFHHQKMFSFRYLFKKIDLSLFSTSFFAKYLRVVEDGPGWGHLCHTDTFLVFLGFFLSYSLLFLRFILRGDLFYVLPCVILFLCFSVLLALRLPRLGKRELTLVLFVRLIDLRLFGFVCFLFLLVSGKGCGL